MQFAIAILFAVCFVIFYLMKLGFGTLDGRINDILSILNSQSALNNTVNESIRHLEDKVYQQKTNDNDTVLERALKEVEEM